MSVILNRAAVILDGVTCSGHRSIHRMVCPRSLYPNWREIWLEPAGSPVTPDGSDNDGPRNDVNP
jgi:hypothetical protein